MTGDCEPRVLHIDSGMTFRGGQRQLALLIDGLANRRIIQRIACPEGSALAQRFDRAMQFALPISAFKRNLQLPRIADLIDACGINIIHAHDSGGHTLGLLVKLIRPKVRLVATRRVIFQPSSILSRTVKYGKRVDAFIAISRAVKRSLLATGVPHDRIELIYSGLDLTIINNAEPKQLSELKIETGNKIVVASAGAFTDEKDIPTTIKAFEIATKERPEIYLVIFGDGPLRAEMEKLIKALNLSNVYLPGEVEPLAPYLKACNIFISTSRSEGLGTAVLTAAACGLPAVVSNVGGLPEIIRDGENGLLCPPGDVTAFATAIGSLVSDTARRSAMGARSKEIARQFDADTAIARTVDLYKRVLVGPQESV